MDTADFVLIFPRPVEEKMVACRSVVDPEIVDACERVIVSLTRDPKLAPISVIVVIAAFTTVPSFRGGLPAHQTAICATKDAFAHFDPLNAT